MKNLTASQANRLAELEEQPDSLGIKCEADRAYDALYPLRMNACNARNQKTGLNPLLHTFKFTTPMTATKHTPGPWIVEGTVIRGPKRVVIAKTTDSQQGYETKLANAQLIAASPELLAALQLWQAQVDAGSVRVPDGSTLLWEEATQRTQAAIAAATAQP